MAARFDPAAELALEGVPPLDVSEWPQAARLRFELAACWAAFPAYEEENQTFRGKDSPHLRRLLETLDRFALKRAGEEELLDALDGAQNDWAAGSAETAHGPQDFAWLLAARCGAWALRNYEPFQRSDFGWRSQDEWGLHQDWDLDPADSMTTLGLILREENPSPELAAELVPWLLGAADPVAARDDVRVRDEG